MLVRRVFVHDTQRPRIYAGLELEFLSARTVAKFIIKSSLLFLSLNKVFPDRAAAESAPQLIFSTSARLA